MTDDSKVTIDRIEMGTGWVAFQPGNNLPKPAKLQAYVNRSFCKITVANHVWFD